MSMTLEQTAAYYRERAAATSQELSLLGAMTPPSQLIVDQLENLTRTRRLWTQLADELDRHLTDKLSDADRAARIAQEGALW